MVSTITCPRCKTQNSKKALVCYKCKNTLKPHKKPSILSSNPESNIELKIIAVGITIFVASNILIMNIAYSYSIMISGFATLLYLYLVLRNPDAKTKKEVRSYGFKVILNYLIIVILGIIALYVLGYV